MKLYNAPMPAPNPRRVRIFLAEKGITIPMTEIAIMKREHKSPEHLARNSLGQVPTLELDDGTTISETVAICRYLESLHPAPPMFGKTAFEHALVDQWVRRVEFSVMTPVGMFWRHAHPFTAAVVVPQYKEFGESNRVAGDGVFAVPVPSRVDQPNGLERRRVEDVRQVRVAVDHRPDRGVIQGD